jgi:signal transduction histidine kinase
MHRVIDPPAALRKGPIRVVVGATVLAVGVLLGWSWWAVPAPAASDSHSPWDFAVLALLAVGSSAGLAGFQWARHRHRHVLRDASMQLQLQAQLHTMWRWETDAQHRLQHWQPPADAAANAWTALERQSLWERFEPEEGHPDSLKARLDAQAVLHDLPVRQRRDGSRWTLRGLPRTDADGRFAGYLGVAQPLAQPAAPPDAGTGAAAAVLDALPGPAWLFVRAADGGNRLLLQHRNDATRQLTRADDRTSTWDEVMAALPPTLAQAARQLSPGSSAQQERWTLHLQQRDASLLLLLLPRSEADDSEAQAEQQSFSYTVSHDLRAPIRVVEGFTRIVKEDYGRLLDRIGNDHLDRVLGAAARMNSMIDALLGLAQLSAQPLARQPVNLSQLAGFIIDDLRRDAPQRACEVRIAPGLMAHGDPTLLRMVLENLLGNAWKYSAKCPHAQIAFEKMQHEGQEVFVVKDNGAGFDMRFADRLFGVFQRLHSANDFQGTGVGLATVRRIVRRHGGDIWGEGEIGQGARFYFTL